MLHPFSWPLVYPNIGFRLTLINISTHWQSSLKNWKTLRPCKTHTHTHTLTHTAHTHTHTHTHTRWHREWLDWVDCGKSRGPSPLPGNSDKTQLVENVAIFRRIVSPKHGQQINKQGNTPRPLLTLYNYIYIFKKKKYIYNMYLLKAYQPAQGHLRAFHKFKFRAQVEYKSQHAHT